MTHDSALDRDVTTQGSSFGSFGTHIRRWPSNDRPDGMLTAIQVLTRPDNSGRLPVRPLTCLEAYSYCHVRFVSHLPSVSKTQSINALDYLDTWSNLVGTGGNRYRVKVRLDEYNSRYCIYKDR